MFIGSVKHSHFFAASVLWRENNIENAKPVCEWCRSTNSNALYQPISDILGLNITIKIIVYFIQVKPCRFYG